MEFIRMALSGPWEFIGCTIILAMFIQLVRGVYRDTLKYLARRQKIKETDR